MEEFNDTRAMKNQILLLFITSMIAIQLGNHNTIVSTL